MTILELAQMNLFSPMVLAFVLGILAVAIRSDLKLPQEIYSFISMYLLFAIGLKGGFELAKVSFEQFWLPALGTLILGILTPVWTYAILRSLGKFDVENAAALAAHYGSVSAVTFSASLTFLTHLNISYEGFMPTLVALLEIPGILVALFLAQSRAESAAKSSWRSALHEVVTGKSILLLIGGVVIGTLSGEAGYKQVSPFFITLFPGFLSMFMLELGVTVGRYLRDIRQVGLFLIGFGILMPLAHGLIGVWVGQMTGLSLGGAVVMGVLAASASYIAAPAAVRIAIPKANPSYYLGAAIGITFPFNLTLGIPLYLEFAKWLYQSAGVGG